MLALRSKTYRHTSSIPRATVRLFLRPFHFRLEARPSSDSSRAASRAHARERAGRGCRARVRAGSLTRRGRGRGRAGADAWAREGGVACRSAGGGGGAGASTPIVLADCLPELCLLPFNLNVEAGMAVGNWQLSSHSARRSDNLKVVKKYLLPVRLEPMKYILQDAHVATVPSLHTIQYIKL